MKIRLLLIFSLLPFPPLCPERGRVRIEPVLDRQYLPALLEMIGSSKEEIYILHFMMNDDDVVEKIVENLIISKERGVKVKIVIEDSLTGNRVMVERLQANGIDAILDGPAWYNHAKVVVVDQKALIGSTNLSYKSMEDNHETNILIEDRAIAAMVKRFVEEVVLSPDRYPGFGYTGDGDLLLLTGREYPELAGSLIRNAKREISLLLYGLRVYREDPESPATRLADALKERSGKGVRVKVILERSGYNRILNRINRESREFLKEGGVTACWDRRSRITHAKLLIADDAALLGSSNWGYGSFNTYREVNLLIRDKDTVRRLGEYFRKIERESSCIEGNGK